jgi:DNA-binding LacI/PurR family transcriptional regulator
VGRTAAECGLDTTNAVDIEIPDRRAPDWQRRVEDAVEAALLSGTTALLVHSDPEAISVVRHCEERDIPVPDALSVIAYDDEVAGLFSPALTAVRPPREWVGRAAVDLVTARLADPSRPVNRTIVSPSLLIRDSTTPPPDEPPHPQHRGWLGVCVAQVWGLGKSHLGGGCSVEF